MCLGQIFDVIVIELNVRRMTTVYGAVALLNLEGVHYIHNPRDTKSEEWKERI